VDYWTSIAVSLLTLTALEIVLGIDNIVFISILSDKLPVDERPKARQLGLAVAMIMRILLLLSIRWLVTLDEPFMHIFSFEISGKDLILFIGGLFLIGKATLEIHDKLEGKEGHASAKVVATLPKVVLQIFLLDVVFSIDSVITAVGMADEIFVMISAVVISVVIMFFSVNTISEFVSDHPTIKILALSFLIMIGLSLTLEALHTEIPKGYIYFAMGFSVFVEFLNMRLRERGEKPVGLRDAYTPEKKAGE